MLYRDVLAVCSQMQTKQINILCGQKVWIFRNNREALAVAIRETGLEVNVDKTKYMVMSRDQNAGRCHNIKIDNSSFERVKQIKYLGTTLKSKFFSRRN